MGGYINKLPVDDVIGEEEAFIDTVADEILGALLWGPGAELGGFDGEGDGDGEGLGRFGHEGKI